MGTSVDESQRTGRNCTAKCTTTAQYRNALVAALDAVHDAMSTRPKPRTKAEKLANDRVDDCLWDVMRLVRRMPVPTAPAQQKRRIAKTGKYTREALPIKDRLLFLEQSTKTCTYCKRSSGTIAYDPDGHSWHVDHVHPVSRGGKHHMSNWTLACRACNLKKNNKLAADWRPGTIVASSCVHNLADIPPARLSFNTEEACALLDVTIKQLRSGIERGEIKAIALGARTFIIPRYEIERLRAS